MGLQILTEIRINSEPALRLLFDTYIYDRGLVVTHPHLNLPGKTAPKRPRTIIATSQNMILQKERICVSAKLSPELLRLPKYADHTIQQSRSETNSMLL